MMIWNLCHQGKVNEWNPKEAKKWEAKITKANKKTQKLVKALQHEQLKESQLWESLYKKKMKTDERAAS